MTAGHETPLKFLIPGWFATVMGWCGLSLAWYRAVPLMGDWAGVLSLVAGGAAALMFCALLAASLARLSRHPQAVQEDLRHPVRHAFVAAVPISVILLATVAVVHGVRGPLVQAAWLVGSVAQLGVTVWALGRWLRDAPPGSPGAGLAWPSMTPALFLPIVGNVLVPLGGVDLGFTHWAAAQFGIGVLFWPVVLTLIAARIGVQGLWPQRLLPMTFITIAPPAVIGLSALQLGANELLVWMAWGVALFFALWSATVARRMLSQPFGMTFWGTSFPLAAFAALSLRLAAQAGQPMQLFALAVLALATLVILSLSLATVRGLRSGDLLVPEPVAMLAPVDPAAASAGPVGANQ